jgi:hypothetical protein
MALRSLTCSAAAADDDEAAEDAWLPSGGGAWHTPASKQTCDTGESQPQWTRIGPFAR